MTGNITMRLILDLMQDVKKELRADLRQDVEAEIRKYKEGYTTRDKWCCQPMRSFAAAVWGISSLKNGDLFSTRLELRGEPANYCPFCGVKL
jgi:hypothetical protein